MKKFTPVIIGILAGCILSFSGCGNLMIADKIDPNFNGKYAVSIVVGDEKGINDEIIFFVIIDNETGKIIERIKSKHSDFKFNYKRNI